MAKKIHILPQHKISFDNNNDNKKKAVIRYLEIKKILNKDTKGLAMLELLFDACVNYVQIVLDFEVKIKNMKEKTGPMYQEEVTNLDVKRTSAHNSLIATRDSFNRYISKTYGWQVQKGKIPPGGICTLPDIGFNNRRRIGDWAWSLVAGFYKK